MWSHRTIGAVVVVLTGSASCDRVLGLEPPVDASCLASDPHDEDGDGVPDSCDPCPGVSNATHSSDIDAVPDACDPRPLVDGDWQAHLITFAEAEADTRWVRTPSWRIVNDALQFADTTVEYQAAMDSLSPFPRPFAFTARVVIDEAPVANGQIALLAADNDLQCGLMRRNGASTVFVFREAGPAGSHEVPTPTPLKAGARYVLELVYDPTSATATCKARDGNSDTAIATISAVATPAEGPIGFEGLSIAASIEYATIYRWP